MVVNSSKSTKAKSTTKNTKNTKAKKGGNGDGNYAIVSSAYNMELNPRQEYTSYCVDNLRPSSFGGKKKSSSAKSKSKK